MGGSPRRRGGETTRRGTGRCSGCWANGGAPNGGRGGGAAVRPWLSDGWSVGSQLPKWGRSVSNGGPVGRRYGRGGGYGPESPGSRRGSPTGAPGGSDPLAGVSGSPDQRGTLGVSVGCSRDGSRVGRRSGATRRSLGRRALPSSGSGRLGLRMASQSWSPAVDLPYTRHAAPHASPPHRPNPARPTLHGLLGRCPFDGRLMQRR